MRAPRGAPGTGHRGGLDDVDVGRTHGSLRARSPPHAARARGPETRGVRGGRAPGRSGGRAGRHAGRRRARAGARFPSAPACGRAAAPVAPERRPRRAARPLRPPRCAWARGRRRRGHGTGDHAALRARGGARLDRPGGARCRGRPPLDARLCGRRPPPPKVRPGRSGPRGRRGGHRRRVRDAGGGRGAVPPRARCGRARDRRGDRRARRRRVARLGLGARRNARSRRSCAGPRSRGARQRDRGARRRVRRRRPRRDGRRRRLAPLGAPAGRRARRRRRTGCLARRGGGACRRRGDARRRRRSGPCDAHRRLRVAGDRARASPVAAGRTHRPRGRRLRPSLEPGSPGRRHRSRCRTRGRRADAGGRMARAAQGAARSRPRPRRGRTGARGRRRREPRLRGRADTRLGGRVGDALAPRVPVPGRAPATRGARVPRARDGPPARGHGAGRRAVPDVRRRVDRHSDARSRRRRNRRGPARTADVSGDGRGRCARSPRLLSRGVARAPCPRRRGDCWLAPPRSA